MQTEAQQGQIGRALMAEADAAAQEGDWQLAVAQARAAGEAFARALRLAEGDKKIDRGPPKEREDPCPTSTA